MNKLTTLFFYLLCLKLTAQIEIQPGQSIQDIVDANPGETVYLLKSGVHRLQKVKPKTGNTFIGENGTTMSGASLLEQWYQQGQYWVHDGQDQDGQRHGQCTSNNNTCQYPEDLYKSDEIMTQVESLGEVNTGSWYFDYDNDKVYMMDSPNGQVLEITTTRNAFGDRDADNVTIKNLIIEKYAIPAQMGAIGDQYPGENWIIEDCEIRYNHGVGVKIDGAGVVRNCYIHHNGQMGVGASGTGGLFEDNEIAYNLTAGFSSGWEGGGSKFQRTDSLMVKNNYVHHNHGPGLWTDIDNYHTTYEGNLVEYNEEMGIFHEISYDCIIRCNTVRYNSVHWFPWLYGSQILISTSMDGEVYDNNVTVSADGGNGITVLNQDRGTRWYSQNNYVHDNHITYLGNEGVSGIATDYDIQNFWSTSNNQFDHNHYHGVSSSDSRWREESGSYTWSTFLNQGQEANGSIDNDLSNITELACDIDCHGDLGGTATIDDCGDCTGGNTGLIENSGCILATEDEMSNRLAITPNPVTEFLTIQSSDKELEWKLYNNQGVFMQTGQGTKINVSQLSSGLHTLVFDSGQVSRFVKR